jgi:hypothetical protein
MADDDATTLMMRWECYVCGMAATCVATDTAERAWREHMALHADPTHFGAWGWAVIALSFD